MSAQPLPFFDRLAARYDETWTDSPAGRMQRNAVWRELDRWINPGDMLLDLGCGTGEDALHFSALGITVDAMDGSPAMVEAARRRGVDARSLRIQQISELSRWYDAALSNFGAMNCVADWRALRQPLATLIRPGGVLALCFMNRFCLWETAHYAVRGRLFKATRRWRGQAQVSPGLRVFYPNVARVEKAFAPDFRLRKDLGIGIAVPPAYVRGLPSRLFSRLDQWDERIATWRLVRATADHRLLIFNRRP